MHPKFYLLVPALHLGLEGYLDKQRSKRLTIEDIFWNRAYCPYIHPVKGTLAYAKWKPLAPIDLQFLLQVFILFLHNKHFHSFSTTSNSSEFTSNSSIFTLYITSFNHPSKATAIGSNDPSRIIPLLIRSLTKFSGFETP